MKTSLTLIKFCLIMMVVTTPFLAHDRNPAEIQYRIDLKTEPGVPEKDKPTLLSLTPRKMNDSTIPELAIAHEKIMHLIIVSKDLSWFNHVHPEKQKDGSLQTTVIFPFGGDYMLFADFTPKWDKNHVLPINVKVMGETKKNGVLIPNSQEKKRVGNYEFDLKIDPKVMAKTDTFLKFSVKNNGKLVADLEPFLGAMGHCVIISEDTKDYLHSHPMEAQGQHQMEGHDMNMHNSSSMPLVKKGEVLFHTQFPKPGIYKVWGQFNHKGQILTADFVVKIK